MKKKIGLALALVLLMSSCSKETYKSLRHQDTNNKVENSESSLSVESNSNSTDIHYTTNASSERSSESSSEVTDLPSDDDTINFTVENQVNIRIAPDIESDVVVMADAGSKFLKIGENGEWTRVTYDGYTGYVLTELLVPDEE